MAKHWDSFLSYCKVYCNGSGFEGGAGASAVLYKDNHVVKSLHFYLGPLTEHTVYESELVGLLLALHLLLRLTCHLLFSVIIRLDNQAAIRLLTNQESKPAHYLLDAIHNATEKLHWCQDRLQHKDLLRWDQQWNQQCIAKSKGIVDLQIHWVPGHLDFAPNNKADELAKEAATGSLSPPKDLPALLRKPLPASLSTLCQESKSKIQWHWARCWKTSPHCHHMGRIDKSILSKKWMKLTKSLSHKQASIVMQLCTGHIGLNKHLHQIKRSDSPHCPNCDENAIETVHHFLFEIHTLQKLRHCTHDLSHLLTHPAATLPLLKFIHATGHLKQTFGAICPDDQTIANTM